MPKISDARRAERRAQILDAAWICFQAQGLHATTMDDIIRRSGLSAGAVYSYFPGKDALIMAAVTTSLAGLRDLMEPILSADPPPGPDALLRQVTGAIARFTAREGYDLRRIALLGWGEAQRNDALREVMRRFYLAFRDRLAEAARRWIAASPGMAGVSEAQVAKTLLSLILGFVVQAALLGDVAAEDMAAGLAGLYPPGAG